MEHRPAPVYFHAPQDVRVVTDDEVGAGVDRGLRAWRSYAATTAGV